MAKKILVVDDESDMTATLKDIFQSRGYQVFVANDGEEAISKMRSMSPDLVILDIVMPKMSGLEVAKTLRSDKSFREIPIIMLTARTDIEDTKEGLALGAAAYVAKPFQTATLLGIVGGLIGAGV
ncbi:MAG: response regulator [Candidatus Omnitrophica bacterium]|nr:response regulator [Candidatus Omnitrophota bacterium]